MPPSLHQLMRGKRGELYTAWDAGLCRTRHNHWAEWLKVHVLSRKQSEAQKRKRSGVFWSCLMLLGQEVDETSGNYWRCRKKLCQLAPIFTKSKKLVLHAYPTGSICWWLTDQGQVVRLVNLITGLWKNSYLIIIKPTLDLYLSGFLDACKFERKERYMSSYPNLVS